LLPPSRVLADDLGVSRDMVQRCYRHLKSLGWIESHGTRGTFVAEITDPPAATSMRAVDKNRLSSYARRFAEAAIAPPAAASEPVVFSAVPKPFLPTRRWTGAIQRAADHISNRDAFYDQDVLGRSELRASIAAFLNRSRGIPCLPDEVATFNISFSALALICRMFLEPGDVIAMEEPGFGGVREVASYLRLEVLPVELDAEGFSVDAMLRSGKTIKAVYVTANHHEPSGTTMSLNRRKQLLMWAQRNGALIIEDDYDALFQYGSTANAPPTLKSMDVQDNVIYLSSFWQVLYPLTTLCYAVLPAPFVEILQHAKLRTAGLTENTSQLALSEMLDDGYLLKHVRKLEREFGGRRRQLIYELKRNFSSQISLPSRTCGLTLMAQFHDYSDAALLNAATRAKLPMVSTDVLYSDEQRRPAGEWSIYFAGLEEQTISRTIGVFAGVLKTQVT